MKNIAVPHFCASTVVPLIIVCLGLPVIAQVPSPSKPPAPAGEMPSASGAHELTAVDVEAFLDGFLPAQIERDDIAGAVVVIVRDGKVLFGKGHGYSDVELIESLSVT